jgi:RND family efflux transporter MFP subunit
MVALLFATLSGCDGNQFEAPPPPTVTVAPPSQRAVTEYALFTGTTRTGNSSDIRARVGGILEEVRFENGAMVQEGDVLFVIDQDPFIASRDAAAARVRSAEAQLGLAETTAARVERSAADGAVTQLQADEARAQAEVAAAALEVAQKELALRQLDVDDSQVSAPRTGLIQKADVGEGDLVNPNAGLLLATIYDDTEIDVWFTVPDRVYLSAIRTEDGEAQPPSVQVATELDEGFPYTGRINYADPVADEQTGTIRLRATVPNPDRDLVGGLFVRIRLPVRDVEDALLVPQTAVATDQVGPYVLVVGEDNMVERRDIAIGGLDGGDRVITNGLSPTDRVIVKGLMRARPGAPVTPVPLESPEAAAE